MRRFNFGGRAVRLASALAALGLLASCGGGDDRMTVQSITMFGDSMNDVGTYQVTTGDPANPGKFTVNPGKVWTENVAAAFGLTLTPNRSLTMDKDASFGATTQVGTATVIGGNGYAEGGARVAMLPSESGIGNNQLVAPVSQQIDNYLATHSAFPAGSLVLIDGGGNDTYAQFSAVCWGTDDNGLGSGNTTIAIATDQIAKAAQAQVDNVKKLKANGAALVLVLAAGNWSRNPFALHYLSAAYQATGCYTPVPAQQVTDWTNQFNQILQSGVSGMPGVIVFDAGPKLGNAIDRPGDFGLVNVTSPACTNTTPTSAAVYCTEATLVAPDAAETYLWSDSFHLTPHGHRMVSDLALQALDGSAQRP